MTENASTSRKSLLTEWGIRIVLGILLFIALAIWFPGVLQGTLNSPRAITLMILIFLVAVGLEWWLRRRGARALFWRGAFYIIMGVAVGGAVLPALYNTTADEEESDLFRRAQPQATSTADGTAAPTGPIELGSDEVVGIDHRASGTVRVAQAEDGRLAVRFEDLDVEPGPDYYIWLVPGEDAQNTDGGTNLGRIKANKGNQEYEAPDDLRLDTPMTVLVWCRAFAVPIANGTIS